MTITRGDPQTHPPYLSPEYASTVKRSPSQALLPNPNTISEQTGPGPVIATLRPVELDLTKQPNGGEAIGQRIIVTGRVFDAHGNPVPNTMVEVWQANASGRYVHPNDQWPGPLDPNFTGAGRVITDREGFYKFTTIKPGAYPWKNHYNAWRPQHIHFSLFGNNLSGRLITQMYFPGDPLLPLDPILNAVPEGARARLVSEYDHSVTEPEWALGYRFNIVLGGSHATPEQEDAAE
jgi:protocatechuate 3,4-dioxygenase beta subunit